MKIVEEGVYFLFDKDELVYIGTSNNIFSRIGQHITDKKKKFDSFEYYETKDRIRLEGFLIRLLKPKYNITMGAYPSHGVREDFFPNHTIEQAIQKYEDYKGDPYVSDIAEEIGTYKSALLSGLYKRKAPVYRIDSEGGFRLDKKWYEENKNRIWDFVG